MEDQAQKDIWLYQDIILALGPTITVSILGAMSLAVTGKTSRKVLMCIRVPAIEA
jgi:hypothetical protein